LSETHHHLADGIELADSLAVDLHKWMYMPFGIGCALVKDRLAHYRTFVYGHEAQYIKAGQDLGKEMEGFLGNVSMFALPLSREFRSLKAYMLLRAYGREKYGRLIQQNLDQAKYLGELVKGDPEMELTAPIASNVVCFRFNPGGLGEDELNSLNKALAGELNKVSWWMFSDTDVKGRWSLRAAITNHRSKREDFDYAYNMVKELGRKALSDLKKK
jgi:glutamate/tyrosine decarboxylase-like PLP-dependent enzyme